MNTASGDVQIRSIGGDAKINSASGDVIIREVAGELSVNSASGDVLVREAGSSVGVNTASGDQEIGSVTTGKVTLKSASGDLKVGIREGTSLWVDARSRSGEVRSELPVSELPPDGNGPSRRAAREHDERRHHGLPGVNPSDPTTGAVVAPAPRRLFRLPEALQARDFRRFWVGRDRLALRRPGDADRAAARRRARPARERRADGLPRRGAALPEPALLAARRRAGSTGAAGGARR